MCGVPAGRSRSQASVSGPSSRGQRSTARSASVQWDAADGPPFVLGRLAGRQIAPSRPPCHSDVYSPRGKAAPMTRDAIFTDTAPAALGPYSQAIVAGGFVFCSGTARIDPATGVAGGGVEAQTELALRNLDAILTAAGTSLSALVKTTIFYTNVEDFATINAVYARFMPDPPPARSAPANVVLPRGLLISIDAVAVLPSPRRRWLG